MTTVKRTATVCGYFLELGNKDIEIYSIATFYENFSLEPKGKYVIGCCLGTACYVKGAQQVIDKFSEILHIAPGETTEEFEDTLKAVRRAKFDMVFSFIYSARKGTPAAEMEFVENEIAVKRAETIEMIQSAIMDAYSENIIGSCLEVLVDGYDEEQEQYFGRTFADSPEIDGRVWIASEEALSEGSFVRVIIDGLVEGDLSGYVVED